MIWYMGSSFFIIEKPIMSKKKSTTGIKNEKLNLQKMPKKFATFTDCVSWIKKSTYLIVRWRLTKEWWKDVIKRQTLWTWVLVSPWRFITCFHVINGEKWESSHNDMDKYFLLRHDDLDNRHISIFWLTLNRNLFLYEKYDLAIIYLDKDFYKSGEKIFKLDNEYVKINKTRQLIGAEIGILGYPHCELTFQDGKIEQPHIGNIILRTDRWVINSRYRSWVDQVLYNEFTIQFNEWNSGGPIFNTNDGTLVWLVKWYKRIITNMKPVEIEEKTSDWWVKKTKVFDLHTSYYSVWIPIENYLDVLASHQIM